MSWDECLLKIKGLIKFCNTAKSKFESKKKKIVYKIKVKFALDSCKYWIN